MMRKINEIFLCHPEGNRELTQAHLEIGKMIAFFNTDYQRC